MPLFFFFKEICFINLKQSDYAVTEQEIIFSVNHIHHTNEKSGIDIVQTLDAGHSVPERDSGMRFPSSSRDSSRLISDL